MPETQVPSLGQRFPWRRNGNPLQGSCLESPGDRGVPEASLLLCPVAQSQGCPQPHPARRPSASHQELLHREILQASVSGGVQHHGEAFVRGLDVAKLDFILWGQREEPPREPRGPRGTQPACPVPPRTRWPWFLTQPCSVSARPACACTH